MYNVYIDGECYRDIENINIDRAERAENDPHIPFFVTLRNKGKTTVIPLSSIHSINRRWSNIYIHTIEGQDKIIEPTMLDERRKQNKNYTESTNTFKDALGMISTLVFTATIVCTVVFIVAIIGSIFYYYGNQIVNFILAGGITGGIQEMFYHFNGEDLLMLFLIVIAVAFSRIVLNVEDDEDDRFDDYDDL